MTITSTTRATNVIHADRWDAQEWQQVAEKIPRLAQEGERLAEVNPAAEKIVGDLWQMFMRAAPELEERDRVAPDFAVNHAVASEFMDSDDCESLRRITVGDRVQSALSVLAVSDTVIDIYNRVGKEVEAEQRSLQDALDALDRLLNPPEGEEPTEEEIAEAEQGVDEAQAGLDEAMGRQGPAIGRAVRKAVAGALTDAEEAAGQMSTWGVDPGERATMDPTAYLQLAAQLNTPRMKQIAEILGRLRNTALTARRTKVIQTPEEVHDVILGDEIARILPSELLALAVPAMRTDFLRRLVERSLLQYELTGYEHKGQGSIIYLEDGSGSMAGARELWAKSVGLALLGIAKDGKRGFHAVHFGGPGQFETFSFPEPAAFTTEKMVRFAGAFLNSGGTNFETPLDEAIRILREEKAATGKISADVIIATDGECDVEPSWMTKFLADIEDLGVSVYGLAIGTPATAPVLQAICSGRVAQVQDLVGGSDVRNIFEGIG